MRSHFERSAAITTPIIRSLNALAAKYILQQLEKSFKETDTLLFFVLLATAATLFSHSQFA